MPPTARVPTIPRPIARPWPPPLSLDEVDVVDVVPALAGFSACFGGGSFGGGGGVGELASDASDVNDVVTPLPRYCLNAAAASFIAESILSCVRPQPRASQPLPFVTNSRSRLLSRPSLSHSGLASAGESASGRTST